MANLPTDESQPSADNRNESKALTGSNATAKTTSNVQSFWSNAMAFAGTVVKPVVDAVTGAASNLASQLDKLSELRRHLEPGAFDKGATDYSNRPLIQVVKGDISTTRSGEQPVGEYRDMFISSVQAQDIERTDVIETFGEPHLFTSGRFTRKYVFSGMLRTTAMNPQGAAAITRVPQHVLFRNFYDRYLRSTAQVQYNYFTRIVVDGDIYEGYCIGYSIPRDATLEMVVPFSLTMIVIRHYHARDNDAVAALSRFAGQKTKRLSPSFAEANMKDAIGDFKLELKMGGAAVSTATVTGIVNSDNTGHAQGLLELSATSSGQVLSIAGDGADIWKLTYADGSPVAGAASRQEFQAVSVELVNKPALVKLADAVDGPVTVSLIVGAPNGVSVVIRVTSSIAAGNILKATSLSLSVPSTGLITSQEGNDVAFSIASANSSFAPVTGGYEITLDLLVTLETAAGNPAPLPSPFDYATILRGTPFVLRRGGAAIANTFSADRATIPSDVDVSGVVVSSPAAGVIKFAGVKFLIAGATDVTATNPLVMSDEIELHLTSTITVPGFLPTTASASIGLGLGKSLLSGSLISGATLVSTTPGKWTFTVSGSTASAEMLLTLDPRAVEHNAGRVLYDSMAYATLVADYGARALVACKVGQSTSFVTTLTSFGSQSLTVRASVSFAITITGVTLKLTVESPPADVSGGLNDLFDLIDMLEKPSSVSFSFPPSFGLPEVRAHL